MVNEKKNSQSNVPWFIHPQSKKLTLLGKKRTQALIEEQGGDELYQRFCQTDVKDIKGAPKVFSLFFRLLSPEIQQRLLPQIDPNLFLEHERHQVKTKQRLLKIQQRKEKLCQYLNGKNPQKIILVSEPSLLDDEIHEGIWHYLNKHGQSHCAFATTEENITRIVNETTQNLLTLIIISHWEPSMDRFAEWGNGAEAIGTAIGSLLNRLPQIGTLRLVSCNTVQFGSNPPKNPDAQKNAVQPCRKKITYINNYTNETPLDSHSLLQQIWLKINKSPQREISLLGCPGFMTFFKGHFVGSEHCSYSKDPSYSNNTPSSAKTVCLTTPFGMKSSHTFFNLAQVANPNPNLDLPDPIFDRP